MMNIFGFAYENKSPIYYYSWYMAILFKHMLCMQNFKDIIHQAS